MRVLDLFCGLGGWGGAFKQRGHEVFGVDWDERFSPDMRADVFDLRPKDLPAAFDVVLASPPCEKFSVLTIGRNWHTDGRPKTAGAAKAEALVWATRILIEDLDPAFWIIENPCGKLRALRPLALDERRTVTYCQYGAPWQKRTDLWSGFPPSLVLRPACTAEAPCYVSAPRGSRSGIQSDSGARKDPLVLWGREMAVVAGASYESGIGRRSRRHAATVQSSGDGLVKVFAEEIAQREWNRKPKNHVAAAQNNGDKSFGRSAILAMIPPELSLEGVHRV